MNKGRRLEREARAALRRQWWVGMNGHEMAFVLEAEQWIEGHRKPNGYKAQRTTIVMWIVVHMVKSHVWRLNKETAVKQVLALCNRKK